MSGNMVNVKVQIPSKGRMKGDNQLQRLLTFDTISSWIRMQGLDDYTTEGLIEIASKYPTQALPSFRRNFNLMIARVRGKRKLEQRGMEENANYKKDCSDKEVQNKEGYETIKPSEIVEINDQEDQSFVQ